MLFYVHKTVLYPSMRIEKEVKKKLAVKKDSKISSGYSVFRLSLTADSKIRYIFFQLLTLIRSCMIRE